MPDSGAAQDRPVPSYKFWWLRHRRTDGLFYSAYAQRLPRGYVRYADGYRSIDMPIGNAIDYASIFGGTVCYGDRNHRNTNQNEAADDH